MMIKFGSKRFGRSNSKIGNSGRSGGGAASVKGGAEKGCGGVIGEIKWELRPGGMLVQKRESGESVGEGLITIRVSTVSKWHDISIESTSTFGKPSTPSKSYPNIVYPLAFVARELKMILSLMTNLEPREQRLLFKGKEREDNEYLHMVGVRDKDKVLLLQDPALKERKLHGLAGAYRTISV